LQKHSPTEYLDLALKIIQAKSMNSDLVDWSAVRAHCFEIAQHAKSNADTYSAINYALAELKDNHSFLVARVQTSSLRRSSPLPKEVKSRVKRSASIGNGASAVGFVVVPSLGSASETKRALNYASRLRRTIAEGQSENVVGWIVDLRENRGGNMWPMLAGIGPLLRSGIVGWFSSKKFKASWFYDAGKSAVILNKVNKRIKFEITDDVKDYDIDIPVAVLIDRATASSGEAIAVAFRGRPNTRFFGQSTCGISTSTEPFKLGGGAILYLTTCVDADRNFVFYPAGIDPDDLVPESELPLGAPGDPCISAAMNWLLEPKLFNP
jgi:carboxyl-terminal processing protease